MYMRIMAPRSKVNQRYYSQMAWLFEMIFIPTKYEIHGLRGEGTTGQKGRRTCCNGHAWLQGQRSIKHHTLKRHGNFVAYAQSHLSLPSIKLMGCTAKELQAKKRKRDIRMYTRMDWWTDGRTAPAGYSMFPTPWAGDIIIHCLAQDGTAVNHRILLLPLNHPGPRTHNHHKNVLQHKLGGC